MMWYEDSDQDGLYDITIGGENGSVQTSANASGMFSYLTNVKTLELSGLDTSNITNMRNMFYKSSSLENVDVLNFDTSNVISMRYMFNSSTNLKTVYVSGLWNTDKVTSSTSMFRSRSSIVDGENNSVTFDSSKIDKTMANYTTGYLTYKEHN